MKKYATTGDGLLTAIMLTEAILESKTSLAKLTEGLTLYPQYVESVCVADREGVAQHPELLALIAAIEEKIAGRGRVLLRKSGTEPVVRVMVECESEADCRQYLAELVGAIRRIGEPHD